jgi:hypothetical protein
MIIQYTHFTYSVCDCDIAFVNDVLGLLIGFAKLNHLWFFFADKSDSDSEGQWEPVNDDDL